MKRENTLPSSSRRRRLIWCSRLAVCLAATWVTHRACAILPPGATPAPNTADSAAAFPKRVTARNSAYGVWSGSLTSPQFGRTGYYALPSVSGTTDSITGMLEFDAAGTTIVRVSPQQLGVTVSPGASSAQFRASQKLTGSNNVTFGVYSSSTYAPVFQHRLTANPSTTTVAADVQGRPVVLMQSGTNIEVVRFDVNGNFNWGTRLTSASFGVNPLVPTDSQTAYALPLLDGSLMVIVVKFQINFTTFQLVNESLLVKLSASGAVEWAKKPSLNGSFVGIPSINGNFLYFTGTEIPTGATTATSTLAAKLTLAGSVVWSKRVSGGAMAVAGDLTGDKVLLTGALVDLANPGFITSAVGVLGSTGALEAQAKFAFSQVNVTQTYPEGNRIWLATVSTSVPTSGTVQAGPVYVGLTDSTLTNIRWRRYKNPMNTGMVISDYDSDDVVASFFHVGDRAMEVMTFKDDFAASVNADLLPETTVSTSSAGLTVADVSLSLTDFSVTSAAFTPTLQTGALTFETLPSTETSIGTGSGGGGGTPTTPTLATQPTNQSVAPSAAATFSVTLNNPSNLAATYQWKFNGAPIAGATSASYTVSSVQPGNVGLYTVDVTSNSTTFSSQAALLSLSSTQRPIGNSVLFASDLSHPNGNIYDQFLMTGNSTTITADPGQVARLSFVDVNDDIVQVEYSGPGTLTLSLANASGPAVAVNYNQPTVTYMKGLPTITITGADQTSNLGIFSVGSLTGNVLVLKAGVTYNGLADIALINISSSTGQFGGVRIGNALLSASSGDTGINAPGVAFTGPIVLHDIDAKDTANPKLITGSVTGLAGFLGEIRIAGGNLLQSNGRSIEFGTATGVRMAAGTNSHSVSLPAVANQGRLVRNGTDVTASVIVGP